MPVMVTVMSSIVTRSPMRAPNARRIFGATAASPEDRGHLPCRRAFIPATGFSSYGIAASTKVGQTFSPFCTTLVDRCLISTVRVPDGSASPKR
jgi:hypothetical protein